jgi:hypothetical protein
VRVTYVGKMCVYVGACVCALQDAAEICRSAGELGFNCERGCVWRMWENVCVCAYMCVLSLQDAAEIRRCAGELGFTCERGCLWRIWEELCVYVGACVCVCSL